MGSWAAVRGRKHARTIPLLAAALVAFFLASPQRADAGLATADLARAEQRLSRVFHEHGLVQVADLGEVWEAATGLPIPLGVIAADCTWPEGHVRAVEDGIRRSIAAAEADPAAAWPFIRAHAQEMSEEVCRRHIALYVNAFSRDLGDEGLAAIAELRARGRAAGALPG